MCILWSVIASSIFLSSVNNLDFLLKSSDLSMVNPHISLNLQNPPIHGAILGFSEDFYCAIHGFHRQSSDLAQGIYFIRSLSDLRVHSSALSGCQCDV